MNDHYDIIVVGSGIAGLYAALVAARHGKVLVLSKGALEESNTRYAQGGIAVALAPGDSPDLHLRDTIAAGDGLCDPAHVSLLTRIAPACILDLLERGVPFDREGDDLAWTREAAHSLPRVLHAGGDATGASVERTLAAGVRAAGVTVREHALCISLLTEPVPAAGNRVTGVEFLLENGETRRATASNVILATGGAGQLFARTTNPPVATGDGLAMAYAAGAEVMDLEFMQFHPTALVLPGAPSFLISEAVRGEGGILRDVVGRAFMGDYHPDRELAPRDVVARAIHRQMLLTDSSHVWLDVTHLPADLVEHRFPSIMQFCRQYGIEPLRETIPVAPAAHYLMGGIRTDSRGRTSLPGLVACGEVACTGVHGANRLASNSLLEGLVFARRAVEGILSEYPEKHPESGTGVTGELVKGFPEPAEASTLPSLAIRRGRVPSGCRSPVQRQTSALRQELAETMWRHASLVRSADSLGAARAGVEDLELRSSGRHMGREERELYSLLLLSALVLEAASLREESRGAHFRADFPHRDPAWQGHIILSRRGAQFAPLLPEGEHQMAVPA